jgi:hypothetical protein
MSAALLHPFVLLLVLACGPATQNAAPVAPPPISSTDPVHRPVGTGTLDTAAAYRTAIADYIKAMSKRDGSFPDTLFIGRHDEFPNIELPVILEHTSIRLVTPTEAEPLKNGEHFAYLNIFGWFTGNKVEFLVVNFKQGLRHRPDGHDDCHLYYSIGEGQGEFALDSLRF